MGMFQQLRASTLMIAADIIPTRRVVDVLPTNVNSTRESEVAGRSAAEFRLVVALGWAAAVLVPASIALVEHGVAAWVSGAISICLASLALYRLQKERLLLKGRTTTIATVTHWQRAENTDGGYSYSVRYQFQGPDGKVCSGKETSQVDLPQQGEMLPVSYLTDDPSQNLPLATFWFFRFTYTGFAKWMDG